jgi:hypothetical protein
MVTGPEDAVRESYDPIIFGDFVSALSDLSAAIQPRATRFGKFLIAGFLGRYSAASLISVNQPVLRTRTLPSHEIAFEAGDVLCGRGCGKAEGNDNGAADRQEKSPPFGRSIADFDQL